MNNDAKAANTIATWWTAKAEEDKDRPKGERAIMAQKLESTFVFGGQMGSTKGSSTATSSGNSTGTETEAASGDSSFFSASSSLSPLRMLRRINMTASAKKEAKQDVKSSLNEFSNPLSRLASLQQLPGNEVCADCLGESPTWASVNRGVFLCTQCSGVHRSLGVHISMILSCRLDNFTESQLDVLEHNGNLSTNERLEYHVPSSWPKPHPEEGRRYRELYIRAKYEASYFARREPQPAVQREAPFKESDSLPSALSDLQTSSPTGSSTSDALSSSPVGMVEYIGYVSVVLYSAKDLLPMSKDVKGRGAANPVVKLTLGSQSVKSQTRKNTVNPDYGAEVLMLCWDGLAALELDVFSKGEHLGSATWPLAYLLEDGAKPGETGIGRITEEDVYGGGGGGGRGGGVDEGDDEDDDEDDDDGSDGSQDSGFEMDEATSHRFSEIESEKAGGSHFDIDDEDEEVEEDETDPQHDTVYAVGDIWVPLYARDATKKIGGGASSKPIGSSMRRMMRGSMLLGKRSAQGKVNFAVSFEPIKH